MWSEADLDPYPVFQFASLLTSYIALLVFFMVLLQVALGVALYVVARWRHYRENQPPDPHLGLKFALSIFRLTSYQLALWALFIIAFAILSSASTESKTNMLRVGFGLLLPSVLVFGAHEALLRYATNVRIAPTVVRLFRGVSLLFTGFFGFAAVVLTMFLWFQKDPEKDLVRAGYALLLVFGVAWPIEGLLFSTASKVLGFPGGGDYEKPES